MKTMLFAYKGTARGLMEALKAAIAEHEAKKTAA